MPSSVLAADGDDDASGDEETSEKKDEEKTYEEMTPQEVRLQAVRLRRKIRALDRADTAAGYGFALRREARLFIGTGLGVIGGTLAVGGLMALNDNTQKVTPSLVSIGVPMGLGVVVAGLPAMILAPRFLAWYAENGPAPSHIARLKLLDRWRLEELRIRRDTALISTAFFGAATILTMAVWAGKDRAGVNGVPGTNYNAGDAITALSFLGVTSGTGATAIIWALQYKDALLEKHRLFVMPSVSLGPSVVPLSTSAQLDGLSPTQGLVARGSLSFAF